MRRYLRVLRAFWSAALAAEMEYRANFVLAFLTSLGNLVGGVFGLFLFYRTGYTFAGWRWEEALVVLGFFTVLEGFSVFLLQPNLNRIVQHVQQGTLDFVLLKPIDSQFWLSTRTFSPWGVPDLLLGAGIIVYAGVRLGLPVEAYLWGLVPFACSVLVLYGLWFVLAATSVWFVKIYNATEVLRSFTDAGRFPMGAYPSAYRFFFTFVIPVAFLTTVPAEALLGRGEGGWIIGAALLAAGLFGFARVFWRFALRYYTSASS